MEEIKNIISSNIKEKSDFELQALFIVNKIMDSYQFYTNDVKISNFDILIKIKESLSKNNIKSKEELEKFLIAFTKKYNLR